MCALEYNRTSVVEVLLQHNARMDLKNIVSFELLRLSMGMTLNCCCCHNCDDSLLISCSFDDHLVTVVVLSLCRRKERQRWSWPDVGKPKICF